jgi:two-component system alkaline phosphatase synthesis response regulator PhoP
MEGKKRILVVDDEPDYAEMVKKYLEKEGFEVEIAYDGAEGLEKVKANPPDAIVLDVMMPEKDGYQVCSELKNSDQTKDIPVVMLTAVSSHVATTKYSHHDGASMEADDYLPKPATPEEITDSVKGLLE